VPAGRGREKVTHMASDWPLVSIITPSYNQGPYIEETILSVLSQDYSNIEYLVMDGGSTDETLGILRRYQDRLTWASEPDRGQAHALNKGFSRARGEIFGWLNSDDTYAPGAIKTAVEALQTHPQIGWVYGDCRLIDGQGNTIAEVLVPDFRWQQLLSGNFIPQPTVFWRREVLEEVGPVDENLHHFLDLEWWIRMGRKFQARRLPVLLANLRYCEGTKSVSQAGACWPEMLGILDELFDDPDLPQDVKTLERQVHCNAYWGMVLEYHYWHGRIPEARESLKKALEWLSPRGEGAIYAINGLTHAAQVSRSARGAAFIERFFSDMGEAAAEVESLKPRILAQVYLAQANQRLQRGEAWPAFHDTMRAIDCSLSCLVQKRFYVTLLKILVGRRITGMLRPIRRRLFRQEHAVVVGDLI